MEINDSEFLKRIQATFKSEAEEHLKSFSAGLIAMEKGQGGGRYAALTETMFREVHSLKGAARSVGNKEIESLCQPLETLFSYLKKKEIPLSPPLMDLFYQCHEFLTEHISGSENKPLQGTKMRQKELINRLNNFVPGATVTDLPPQPVPQSEIKPAEPVAEPSAETGPVAGTSRYSRKVTSDMVRIPVSKLDPLLFQAEELLQAKNLMNQQAGEIRLIGEQVSTWRSEEHNTSTKRRSMTLEQWEEWRESNEMRISNLENQISSVETMMERNRYHFDRMIEDHLDSIKQVLMLPVSTLVESFPVMVRLISRDVGKDIEFEIQGSELEIDKRILEEIKDPLIHMIRNCIDHGFDVVKQADRQGRSPQGKITLSFKAHEGGLFEITVADNGKGIDRSAVLKAAVKSGVISGEAANSMEPEKILGLIFHSGVSTSPMITDLSGRGLGLSIVREKTEKLNGSVTVESAGETGTTFRMLLPITLATFRGIVVRVGDFVFIIPTINVVRVIRIMRKEIRSVENQKTLCIEEEVLPLIVLSDLMGIPEKKTIARKVKQSVQPEEEFVKVIVLVSGENRMAFIIDDVIDEQHVLVKGLGKLLGRVKNISGATILGSGKIVPVLHIPDVMKSASDAAPGTTGPVTEETEMLSPGKLLVAEDSITSRTLLKNILETAGYQVSVAIDGADALAKAKSGTYDLIVSDVDMPRMNGFELTTRIRNDKKLGDTPVVLVTALESKEDRERGIEAGADAYIVKSSFDQGNLLEVIKRLI